MLQLLVIADDLTGALDTGVQLAKRGIETEVRIFSGAGGASPAASSFPVMVVDTQSRHLPPEEAFARVRDAARKGCSAGARGFYKKTDSTLRGNIGAEIAGLLAGAEPRRPLIFIPAFPALGRTTRLCRQYVGGVSLEKTAFARDRLNPITTADIAEIIKTQAPALDVLSVRPGALAETLGHCPPEAGEKTVIVADGENEEDLAETFRQIAAAGKSLPADAGEPPLLAGCAGFAAYLPELLGIAAAAPERPRPEPPFLVINGSLNSVSLNQVRTAIAGGFKDIRLRPEALAPRTEAEEKKLIIKNLKEYLSHGQPAVLRNVLRPEELEDYLRQAAGLGIPEKSLHTVLPRVYGEILRGLVSEMANASLAVFGGDTLAGILNAFGKSSIIPLAEIFPGVVIARIPGIENPRYIVTKAGGFGDENLLRNIPAFPAE
jgi:uncharacterized protein YgbK (DUF1537 family)